MKRLALFAAVIAVAAGVSATAASAGGNGNQTPGCQSSTWDVTLTGAFGTASGYHMNPLVRCHPTAGSKGTWTLSGTAYLDGGCTATVSGTLHGTDFSADWSWYDPCTGEVTSFTGTLSWGDNDNPTTGSGSGTWTDNYYGSGGWTAARTS